MNTIHLSYALQNCSTQEAVVELINEGTCEGMGEVGGTEFTSEMLAGQYAFEAARDGDYGTDETIIVGHLECISDAGAKFNHAAALAHGLKIASASDEK